MLAEYRKIVNELNDAFNEFYVLSNKNAKKIDEYHLTFQQEVMMLYIMRNERITANDIAAKFEITKSAVSQVISKLEARHFIVRESNPSNRREFYIILGEEGHKYAELIKNLDETLIRKYYSQIDIADLQHMTRTMKKINEVIIEHKDNE
ncbi:MarR family winged helix-turn-helix transcriptional regulator [Paenibacillus alba]|uniref:MarR family transcriptional regulator n=1 Tax=Paenibacillus alba TaxID=1197127 RepID=A0ABU6GDY1_9BACL|nr:MarR family transcriptional regulator [Paenibacillus alba]MEC0232382.1 MarR family transcriptional regulator [Paenibacillus alba]